MKDNTITCDHCGRKIETGNCEDYYLHLSSQPAPHIGHNVSTLMAVSPPINRDMDFCDMRCLAKWIAPLKSPWSGKLYSETPIPGEAPK